MSHLYARVASSKLSCSAQVGFDGCMRVLSSYEHLPPALLRLDATSARLIGVPLSHCKSRCVSCAGERRSANRTAWSTGSSGRRRLANDSDHDPEEALPDDADLVWASAARLQPSFAAIDRLVQANLRRVLGAFAAARVGPHHFCGSTGYGHGDEGRAALDEVFAAVMQTEKATVRLQFVSGTHAIAAALFGCLRPGDDLLAVAGRPYDTLEEVIGLRGSGNIGSLRDWGVTYREAPLSKSNSSIDYHELSKLLQAKRSKVALVQRSCGYALRPTLTIDEIGKIVAIVRENCPDCLVLVDNCYGEFTEDREPGAVGADLVMGSLIKSPGGTIVPGGGYIAGRADLVRAATARLSAPGVGIDAGCVSGEALRLMFQGLFLAPQMVGEALKGGRLLAEVFQGVGYTVHPKPDHPDQNKQPLPSFITAIELGSPAAMEAFCRAVQQKSPVGSYVRPIPGQTAGYGDEVIFADGTFINGSTAELSADGPMRGPYVIYCQGGTHWTHWAICLEDILPALRAAGG